MMEGVGKDQLSGSSGEQGSAAASSVDATSRAEANTGVSESRPGTVTQTPCAQSDTIGGALDEIQGGTTAEPDSRSDMGTSVSRHSYSRPQANAAMPGSRTETSGGSRQETTTDRGSETSTGSKPGITTDRGSETSTGSKPGITTDRGSETSTGSKPGITTDRGSETSTGSKPGITTDRGSETSTGSKPGITTDRGSETSTGSKPGITTDRGSETSTGSKPGITTYRGSETSTGSKPGITTDRGSETSTGSKPGITTDRGSETSTGSKPGITTDRGSETSTGSKPGITTDRGSETSTGSKPGITTDRGSETSTGSKPGITTYRGSETSTGSKPGITTDRGSETSTGSKPGITTDRGSETSTGSKPGITTDRGSETSTGSKPGITTDRGSETSTGSKPGITTDRGSETSTGSKPGITTDRGSETSTGSKPGITTYRGSETSTGSKPGITTDRGSETSTGSKPGITTDRGSETSTGSKPGITTDRGSETSTGSKPGITTDRGSETSTGSKPGITTDRGSETSTGSKPETTTHRGSETSTGSKPETTSGSRPDAAAQKPDAITTSRYGIGVKGGIKTGGAENACGSAATPTDLITNSSNSITTEQQQQASERSNVVKHAGHLKTEYGSDNSKPDEVQNESSIKRAESERYRVLEVTSMNEKSQSRNNDVEQPQASQSIVDTKSFDSERKSSDKHDSEDIPGSEIKQKCIPENQDMAGGNISQARKRQNSKILHGDEAQGERGQDNEASSPAQKQSKKSVHESQKPIPDMVRLKISYAESQLLCRKDIRNEVFWALKDTSWVDKQELEKGHVICVREKRDTVLECLRSNIKTRDVPQKPFTDLQQIEKIAAEFSEKLYYSYDDKKQFYNFAFHKDIEAEVIGKLHTLSMVKKSYDLPCCIVSYIRRHLQYFIQTIRKQLEPFPAEVVVETQSSPPGITVISDKYPEIEMVLDKLFSELQYTEVEISTEKALYLQTLVGTKHVKDIENGCHCKITVRSPGQQVLLRSESPMGRQLLVCHGDIQYTDCQVLVLPLCEGQTEWSPQYKCILDRGFLSSSVQTYATKIGPPPMSRFTLPLKATVEEVGRHVLVMYVPGPSSQKKKEKIMTACKEALDFAASKKFSLALPLKLGDYLSESSSLKAILHAIREFMEREESGVDVVLYVSDVPQSNILTGIGRLLEHKGWDPDTPLTVKSTHRSSCHIKVAVGELQNFKADVVVNSTDPRLDHTHAPASYSILKVAGGELQRMCQTFYPKGIEDRIVAVTETQWLTQWKEIYHIVLPQEFWRDELEDTLLGELKKRIQACLTVASAKKHTSIAFPTLGTGNLQYPPEKVAKSMLKAARDFFIKMPHSSLMEITIVCFPQDPDIIKVFKAEEAVHTFKIDKPLDEEARLAGDKTLVQIIVSEKVKEKIPEICYIVFDFNQENDLKKKEIKQKGKVKLLNEALSEAREKMSVQINLRKSDSEDFSDIIKAVVQWLADGPECLHVLIAVPDINSLQKICENFQEALKERRRLWARLLGKSEFKAAMIPPSDPESTLRKNIAVVCIHGTSFAIDEATSEVWKISIPQEYKQLASEFKADGSKDAFLASGPSMRHHDRPEKMQEATNQKLEQPREEQGSIFCTFTIPTTYLHGLGESAFKGATKAVIQRDKSRLLCSVPFEDLTAAVLQVVEVIRSAGHMAKERNVPTLRAHEKNPVTERTIDVIEYEAMKYLLGQSFTDCVTNKIEKDEKVTFSMLPGQHVENIDQKIDLLRKEAVPVGETELQRLENLINARAEGVEAFMKVLQQERKVAILCFDYNNLNKARHLLRVKVGQIKPTSRGNRSFADGSAPGASQQSSGPAPSQPADCLDLVTKSGIKVSVYKTDITKLPVDAIVNAANEHLQHGGGVAAAIAAAAGIGLEDEGAEYISKHGLLKVTQVVVTRAGALPCKSVLHAVGPQWVNYQDKAGCQQDLEQTVFNCLETASDRKFGSLAVSSISAAIFGVPKEVCAEAYLQAVKRFDDRYGAKSCLREIHFVDISNEMVSRIQEVFSQKWSSVLSGQSTQHSVAGTEQLVASVTATQQIRTDLIQTTTSVEGRQQNEAETTQSDIHVIKSKQQSTVDDAQASRSPNRAQHKATDKTYSEDLADSLRQNVTQQASLNFCGKDSQRFQQSTPTAQLNVEPELTVVPSVGTLGEHQWQFHFPGLDLVILQDAISRMSTNGMLFWHIHGRPFGDWCSFFSYSELKELKSRKWTEGEVYIVKSPMLFPVVAIASVPPLDSNSEPAITRIMEKALKEVDLANVKSLTVPRFPCPDNTKMDIHSMASVIYGAVVQFTGRPKQAMCKIHVVDRNKDYIHSMVNNICGFVARAKSSPDDQESKRSKDSNRSVSARPTTSGQYSSPKIHKHGDDGCNASTGLDRRESRV